MRGWKTEGKETDKGRFTVWLEGKNKPGKGIEAMRAFREWEEEILVEKEMGLSCESLWFPAGFNYRHPCSNALGPNIKFFIISRVQGR